MSLAVLGLDIGGANLKAAWYCPGKNLLTPALSRPFALWKNAAGLADQLVKLSAAFPPAELTAVTMTGELCDCFAGKRQGVQAILGAVEAAFPIPVRFWTTQGRFVDFAAARAHPLPLASANWLALATFAARFAPPSGTALLIDVGSTTTDIIPLQDGRPIPCGRSDPERLRSGELVYTGVRRTPVCALVQQGVAAEVFATTLDAYLLFHLIPESPADCNTADGQPATIAAADLRLARMLGADLETSKPDERRRLAESVILRQVHLLRAALRRVLCRFPGPPMVAVLAGEGTFLASMAFGDAPALPGCRRLWLATELGRALSTAACAYAVAVLAAEQEAGSQP
jgi:probable H4MPT-linked C1 transfer pathway protein